MLAVNGNLPFSTVLADGAETTLPASANSDIYTQEVVQEVQVGNSAFSAQYGVGGILYNQISKGGTDHFHGSAYEYFQNDAMNAYNYNFGGTPQKPRLRYNNFGGSIGGPILKRKLLLLLQLRQDHPVWGFTASVLHSSDSGRTRAEILPGFLLSMTRKPRQLWVASCTGPLLPMNTTMATRFPPAGSTRLLAPFKNTFPLPMRPEQT